MDRLDAAHALLDVSIKNPESGAEDALEALAALATSAAQMDTEESQSSSSSSSRLLAEEEEEVVQLMSEFRRRPRSVSNPEGMEKWSHFILKRSGSCSQMETLDEYSTFEGPSGEIIEEREEQKVKSSSGMEMTLSLIRALEQRNSYNNLHSLVKNEDSVDLLKKARARLLEDLAFGEKGGFMNFPHSMKKYQDVYNKNGFIGIYSPNERAAIIARFHRKRQNRVWNKKIRYNCRKDLADRRLRIKGRFVKRDSAEAKAYYASIEAAKNNGTYVPGPASTSSSSTSSPTVSPTPEDQPKNKVAIIDDTFPVTNDAEAGFCPTVNAPFRRARRHTVV